MVLLLLYKNQHKKHKLHFNDLASPEVMGELTQASKDQ